MDVVSTVDDGNTAVIMLDRRGARNALTVAFVKEISDHVTRAKKSGANAIVLGSRGPAFCAGGDLDEVSRALHDNDAPRLLGGLIDSINALILEIRTSPMRTVVALEGAVAGAGIGLALAADIRVCGASAKLIPAFLGVGTTPDAGTSYFLVQALGPARSLSLLARNSILDASQLLQLGLAERVVADGHSMEEALVLVRELRPVSPAALLETRRLIDAGRGMNLAEQMGCERASLERMWQGADCREGAMAFIEGRPPCFEAPTLEK
jgi:2-(1,2-epoxy-1,2-dihydrophenyl)acetyl-CoA isomerase